jgi:hypothetical protein
MFSAMFNTRQHATASTGIRRRARRVEAWRAAAGVVWMRWEALLAAPPEARARAFAAYMAALDAEAAAAVDLAATTPRPT